MAFISINICAIFPTWSFTQAQRNNCITQNIGLIAKCPFKKVRSEDHLRVKQLVFMHIHGRAMQALVRTKGPRMQLLKTQYLSLLTVEYHSKTVQFFMSQEFVFFKENLPSSRMINFDLIKPVMAIPQSVTTISCDYTLANFTEKPRDTSREHHSCKMLCKLPREKSNPKSYPDVKPSNHDSDQHSKRHQKVQSQH